MATGTYTDGSTAALTSSVSWASSNVAVATIDDSGLATAVGTGVSSISAALGGVTGTTTLTVTVVPALNLTLNTSTVAEAAGANAATGTLTRNTDLNNDVVVTLTSDDTAAATVPATVTIPAGQASVTFPIAAVDDGLVDGPHTATFTATAAGFDSGTAQLTVDESDVPTLTVSIDPSTVEEGGSVTGTVVRNWITSDPLPVTFTASTDNRMTLPVVVIPANQSTATFTVGTIDTSEPEKDATFTLTAASGGFVSGTASLTITDHHNLPTLTLSPSTSQVVEDGSGVTYTVTRAVAVDTPLTVKLFTSDANLATPASDTVVIPAYQTSTTFVVNPVENHVVEGNQTVTITANGAYASCGCTILSGAGTASLLVIDSDAPALQLATSQTSALEGVTGAFTITLTRNTSAANDLVVGLSTSDSTELPVPSTVTIPAGQYSTTVTLNTGSSPTSLGSEQVNLTATADGLASAALALTVISRNAPDLGVSAVTAPASGLMGDSATVGWTDSNTGRLAAAAPWIEDVYFSPDPFLDAGAVPAAELTIDHDLPAGATSTRSAPVLLPTTPGAYYTIVVVDATDVLPDLDQDNNQAVSAATVNVEPTYGVTVSTPTTIAPAGTPIQLSGTATLTGSTQPAANVPVTVRVIANGQFRRVLTATTDDSGNYSVIFTPLPNEAGEYTVAAAHPSVVEDVIQAQFELVGMSANPASLSLNVVPGTPLTGTVEVDNLGSVPLTGLTVAVQGAPANVIVNASLSAAGLSGSGSVTLGYTITAADASTRIGNLQFVVTSTEGATVAIPLSLTVIPLTPVLTANPGSLLEGVVVGQQDVVSFAVTNSGGVASGPLTVELPTGIPWLALASVSTIPSLAPGAMTTVTLTLTPPADTTLALFEGTITLLGSDSHLDVGYQIRTVTTAVGNLQVNVQDEYTSFVAGAPLVAGATVELLDPYDNTIVVAQGTTDSTGKVLLSNVPAGTYVLDVEAANHDPYRGPVTVVAGILNQASPFISRQTVSYSWDVEPATIQDTYTIQLQSVFETGVPIPVVTLDLPASIPALAPGQTIQVMATITNHGLIAAEQGELVVPAGQLYTLTPLITDLGTIPAMSSFQVPVLVTAPTTAQSAEQVGASAPQDYHSVCADLAMALNCIIPCAVAIKKSAIAGMIVAAVPLPLFALTCLLESFYAPIVTASGGGSGGGPGTGGGGGGIVRPVIGAGGGFCSTLTSAEDATASDVTAQSNSVCAKVRIQIDQTAVTAREVFTGAMEIDNASTTDELKNVQITLHFVDESGNAADDKFTIIGPDLTGLNAADGTGILLAGASALAKYTFIPNDSAALSGPTRYYLDGTLQYLDISTGEEVVIPLVGSTITVMPNPEIVLNYFLEKNVVGDDPNTPQIEPSEPFTLGLLATNVGAGTANDFTITSGQPTIVENEKGLLIDFNIIGSQVGNQPVNPSLTVDLGNLVPGQTQVASWSLTSSLAGQFIDYSASFTHDNALGGLQTSLIDSVTLHELIHEVQANRPGDDDLPDFLANDSGNPDGLPDTLYMSNGTVAPVNLATSITTDGPVTAGHRTVTLTANQVSGWTYLQLPDPGAGWKLERVVRSDGTSILVGPDAWQTDKVFNETTNTFDSDPLLHILDFNGTGSYTLYYVEDISTPPAIAQLSPVTPNPRNAPVDSVDITFTEPIDLTTFGIQALTLTQNGGPNLINGNVTIQAVPGTDATYQIGGLTALTTADGTYTLTVSAAQIQDLGDNLGSGTATIQWSNGVAPTYVLETEPVGAVTRNTPLDEVDVKLSLPIEPASFTTSALSLTCNGTVVPLPAGVTVSATDDTGTYFAIKGLSAVTGPEGTYELSVNASVLVGTDGLMGLGTSSTSWVMDTTPPTLVSVQQPTTSPRNTVILSFNVTFSEPINLATFDLSQIELDRDGAPITLDDRVAITAVGGDVYQITGLNWFMGLQGDYTLTVNGNGVQDLAGNIGSGQASATWVMETVPPDAPTNVALTPDNGVSNSDGITNTELVSITGTVDAPGLSIRIYDNSTGHEIGFGPADGLSFSIPINLVSPGAHELWVDTVDAAGNVSDNAVLETFIDLTPPSLVQVNGVPTAATTQPVDALDFVFSKAINLATLDPQAMSLTVNGGTNLITDRVSVSLVSGTTYRISGLAGLTSALGAYTFTIDLTKVQDLAGNSGVGTSSVTWTTTVADSTAPTSSATAPAMSSAFNFTVAWSGQDNPGGSGIAYYDIYSNEDGGPFTLWQYHTTATSATFLGSDQHSYSFFSIATDVAGNQEAMKSVGDATTLVSIRGEIQGHVFDDVNETATDTAGAQNGLGGWTIFLDLANDGHLDPGDPSTTTADDGSFSFTGLEPGTYTVAEVLQPGWLETYPAAGDSSVQEAKVTVGASNADAPVYLADTPGASGSGSTGTVSSTAVNQALIGLTQFQSDPRFSGLTGQGETVVVLDSGVDATNPDFGPIGPDGLAAGVAYEYDFVDNTSAAPDPLGHGTLVASIIGARDAANPGIAPGVQIIDLKVLNASGQGDFATVERALDWVSENVAKYNIVAVNMSFGDGGDYTQPQSLYGLGGVLAQLASEGVITVSAAGNNFYGDQSAPGVAYPAADPNSLAAGAIWSSNLGGPFGWSTGAIDYTTAADQIMSFSQRDNALGEVFAPGAFIQGASPGGGVQALSGTSMAAPELAGVAALADQVALEALGRRLLPAEFRYLLAETSTVITDTAGSDNVANTGSTYLQVNVDALAAAILGLKTNPIPPALLNPGSSSTGGTAFATSVPSGEQSVSVTAGAPMTGIDFGNFLPGTVSGIVYLDANGDGMLDQGDPVFAGWKVTLHSEDGVIVDQTVVTDASGHFSFTNLPAGRYTLSETAASGYRPDGAAGSYPDQFEVTSQFAGTIDLGNQVFAAPTNLAISPDNGSSSSDDVTDTGSITISGKVDEAGLDVHLYDATTGTALRDATVNGQSFSAALSLAAGVHDIRATAVDAFGDTSLVADMTVTIDLTAPKITAIAAVSPNLRNTSVSTVDVTFSKVVDPATFNAAAITLTRNGSNVSLAGLTFTLISGTTYRIGGLASSDAAAGNYALSVGGATAHDLAGNVGTGSVSTSWLMDATPPTSKVSVLPNRETTLTFAVSVTGSDGGSPPSGVKSYDIYSSTNGGPWTFWTTVSASSPTSNFSGQSNTSYSFYSIAHDLAGNTEVKQPSIEASTYLPNLTPPVTTVNGATGSNPSTINTASGTFTLNLTGNDPGGGLLTYFELFVSVDGGAYQEVGPYAIPAGLADTQGNYHSTMPYQGSYRRTAAQLLVLQHRGSTRPAICRRRPQAPT